MADKRASEQFRKRKKNYFRRALEISQQSGADIYVLIRRNGVHYSFNSTNSSAWPPDPKDLSSMKHNTNTAADLTLTASRDFNTKSGNRGGLRTKPSKLPKPLALKIPPELPLMKQPPVFRLSKGS
ncbi:hypothetical protein B0J12DRAFT_705646 [Macrophomina phaseolina]|uniref:Transcription factor MADS-box n=1 Tax=Macrophomina phaseolina TaxID=35725 RepID=A0ABQ8FRG4_9PEZI|nr:hypothetical protein B0J12DRAFT_705646 [Macrophomina phaseolina]